MIGKIIEVVTNPRAYLAWFFGVVKLLLFAPDTFFEEHVGSDGLKWEFIIVGVTGIIGTAGLIYGADVLTEPFGVGFVGAFEEDAAIAPRENQLLWGYAFRPLLLVFFLWLGYAVAFYALSWLWTETGSLYSMIKLTAWGFVPYAFYQLVYSAGAFYAFFGLDVDTDVPVGSEWDRVWWLWEQGLGEPIPIIAALTGVLFLVWSGYIWQASVKHARNLPTENARIVVAIPVIFHIGYIIYTYIPRLF